MKIIRVLCLFAFFCAFFITEGSSENHPGPEKAPGQQETSYTDHGQDPWIIDIEELTLENDNFRIAKWTGEYLQMTVMSIPPGEEIGGEIHPNNDQFIRIEQGEGRVLMGPSEEDIVLDELVAGDWAIFIPAGDWHNLLNVGNVPLKLYSIYSPPEHPKATLHRTITDSEEAHHHH